MSASPQLIDDDVPEAVVIRIDGAASPEEKNQFTQALASILDRLNWRTHFYLVSEGGSDELEFCQQIVDTLARYLVENRFVTFHVHPVLRVGAVDGTRSMRWRALVDSMRPFQRQAFEQQGEVRLLIVPIIEREAGGGDGRWMEAARYFEASLATPSVLLRGSDASREAREAAAGGVRFYIDPRGDSGTAGVIEQLAMNASFDDLLERVKGAESLPERAAGADLFAPCGNRPVIDQPRGKIYACFRDWSNDRPLGGLEELSQWIGERPSGRSPDECSGCISRSLCSMTGTLIANGNQAEGHKVHLQVALALLGGMQQRRAMEHAARARDLAGSDAERASALICEGLCRLEIGEFEVADRALGEAAGIADDPGLVSYHRGRVQFEWRDYIEALDRFGEALSSESAALPKGDLFFYMAVSHIHIAEYQEARSFLDRLEETGLRRGTVHYYRGLCELGEERPESALSELRAAEAADSGAGDLGNILFYTGVCLKELGRYAEAIPVLERAVPLDSEGIETLSLLGFCYYKTARHADAVDCFEKVIARDPSSAIDYANLASNLRDLGRTDEAIAMYRRALSLDPNIAFARESLERLLERG